MGEEREVVDATRTCQPVEDATLGIFDTDDEYIRFERVCQPVGAGVFIAAAGDQW